MIWHLNIKKLYLFVIVAAISIMAMFVLGNQSSHAVYPSAFVVPNGNDFSTGGNVYLEVSKRGNGNGLHAPVVGVVAIFNEPNNNRIIIEDGAACTSSPDAEIAPTVVQITDTATRNVNVQGISYTDDIFRSIISTVYIPPTYSCPADRNIVIDLPSLPQSTKPGNFGKYVAHVFLTHIGPDQINGVGGGGINAFKIYGLNPTAGSIAQMGYRGRPDLATPYSIQDRRSVVGSSNTYSNFNFGFGVPCGVPSFTLAALRWTDADWNGIQQNGPGSLQPFYMRIVKYPVSGGPGTVVAQVNGPQLGGNDEVKSIELYFEVGYRYDWQWFGVHRSNGVQLFMPFDSTTFSQDCADVLTASLPTCTVSVNRSAVNAGEQATYTLQATNPGNATVDVNSSTLLSSPPGGFVSGFGNFNIAPGATVTRTVDVTMSRPGLYRGDVTLYTPNGNATCNTLGISSQYPYSPFDPATPYDPSNPTVGIINVRSLPPTCVAGALKKFDVGSPYNLQAIVYNPNSTDISVHAYSISFSGGTTPANQSYGGPPLTVSSGSAGYTITSGSFTGITLGTYNYDWVISANDGVNNWNIRCGSGTSADPGDPTGSNQPTEVQYILQAYSRFYGGDVIAGGGITDITGVCTPNSGAEALGFMKGDNATNFAGTGAELAVFAAAQVRGVQALATQNSRAPGSLTFANTNLVPPVSSSGTYEFGGSFGGRSCVDDYANMVNDPSVTVADLNNISSLNVASLASGAYKVSPSGGEITLTNSGIEDGKRITLYINGDVYISGSGTFGYANSSWAGGRNSIPSMQIVSTGNININHNITRLDGLFVAQPLGDNTKGEISTCASNSNHDLTGITAADQLTIINDCGQKLTIFGAFVAKQVHLFRHVSSVGAATPGAPYTDPNIGEVFIYSPEMYLVRGGSLPRSAGNVKLQSINALPPVF